MKDEIEKKRKDEIFTVSQVQSVKEKEEDNPEKTKTNDMEGINDFIIEFYNFKKQLKLRQKIKERIRKTIKPDPNPEERQKY